MITMDMFAVTSVCLLLRVWCAAASSVSQSENGEIKLFQSPVTYNVESMVLLNDAGRKDKEVGYKVTGRLDVIPVWGASSDCLLKFVLRGPRLLTRGKRANADYLPVKSLWAARDGAEFYARWTHGLVAEAYLDPDEPADVLNYEKSLIGLFQLQPGAGERDETDASGACRAQYDAPAPRLLRKTKRQCAGDAAAAAAGAEPRRLARYTLSDALDALDEVHAEEVHVTGRAQLGAAVKARAWLRLRREGAPPAAHAAHARLSDALAAMPTRLRPLPLPMAMTEDVMEDEAELERAVAEALRGANEAEGAGGGGAAAGAAAALRAVRALRRAPAERTAAALRAQPDARSLAALCRLAGAAGSARAHAAVARELPLLERDASPHAALYLHALALARAPDESVVLEALRLGGEARAPEVREAALLAAAAGAARLPQSAAAAAVRDALPRLLARCTEDECRAMHARALGNLARGDAADLLLALAERGGPAALHALQALRALPPPAIGPALQRRLAALVHATRPLEQRAAALDLLLVRSVPLPQPLVLARLARELYERGPAELRRLFWQRSLQLAAEHAPLADVLSMLAPELRGWHARAQAGTSSVMARSLGRFGTGEARLESLQLARGGLLRRGVVELRLPDSPAPLLAIELWTRGLAALAGGDAQPDAAWDGEAEGAAGAEEAEEMSAGLALSASGARLPAVELFHGQAELLGHIWAGTGSAPTPALRAFVPLGEHMQRVPLLAAGELLLHSEAAMALALDAQAQVSLWSRTARTQLELRVGAAGGARAALRLASGTLQARSEFAAEPRLRVSADLDFYERVSLCVRAASDDYEHRSNSTLESAWGFAAPGVRRARLGRTPQPGRTLSLGALNDAACSALLA